MADKQAWIGPMKRPHKNNTAIWLVILLLAGLHAPAVMAKATVDSVRLHRAPDHTRIVFDLPEPVEHNLEKLGNPDRVVVDLLDAELDFDIDSLDYEDGPIADIRVGKHADKTRVVFDMDEGVRPRTNLLKPIDPHGWRLVVDLFDKEVKADPAAVENLPEEEEKRLMVVAIDAGHGGEDPGAHGPSGTVEKTVVLQIARKLQNLIKDQAGMRPVMVRDGDYYVPLAERRRIAREKYGADVFLSIHADAFTDPRANGVSVFALSNSGATSAKARHLAKIANESDQVAGVYEEEKDDSNLLSVLADLQVTGSMSHSLYLGRKVLEEMGQVTKLHGGRKRVEQAGFAVLKEPRMVSILVETGFISNRNEERKLRSGAHQRKLAKAILNGVHAYFRTHPEPGSWYAAQRRQNGDQYRIQPGDTLSEIASRYSVSAQALRMANGLEGSRIQVGQMLKIPGS